MGDILEMDYMYFKPLVDSVSNMDVGNDWFLVANDFASYLDCQARHSFGYLKLSLNKSKAFFSRTH